MSVVVHANFLDTSFSVQSAFENFEWPFHYMDFIQEVSSDLHVMQYDFAPPNSFKTFDESYCQKISCPPLEKRLHTFSIIQFVSSVSLKLLIMHFFNP